MIFTCKYCYIANINILAITKIVSKYIYLHKLWVMSYMELSETTTNVVLRNVTSIGLHNYCLAHSIILMYLSKRKKKKNYCKDQNNFIFFISMGFMLNLFCF